MDCCIQTACSRRILDVILACFLFTPLAIVWWSGTWQLMDVLIFPNQSMRSHWISFAIGIIVCNVCYFINPLMVNRNVHNYGSVGFVIHRIFNYVFSFGYINYWRGVWNITDDLINSNNQDQLKTSLICLLISLTILGFLRGCKNCVSLPFGINTEFGNVLHLAKPRFRSEVRFLFFGYRYFQDTITGNWKFCIN